MATPTLDQIYQDAQRLPLEDQRALIALIEPPKSLEEISAEQGVGPFDFQAAQAEAVGLWLLFPKYPDSFFSVFPTFHHQYFRRPV